MDKNKENIGRVVQVIGPVVDVEFKDGELPEIYNAIRITSEGIKTPSPVDQDEEPVQKNRLAPILPQYTGFLRGETACR